MKKLSRILSFVSLFALIASAHADLADSVKIYKTIFEVSATERFTASPFDGFYLSQDATGNRLFSADVSITGYLDSWEKTVNGQDIKVPAESVKKLLRTQINTDWLIKLDVGSGHQRVVIISAPDCPICQLMEKDLRKFSKQLDASIYIAPLTLAAMLRNEDPFSNAAMCGTNPLQTWNDAMSRRNIQKSNNQCLKATWVRTLAFHTWTGDGHGMVDMHVPAIIRQDGSSSVGWPPNMDLTAIKSTLGIQ